MEKERILGQEITTKFDDVKGHETITKVGYAILTDELYMLNGSYGREEMTSKYFEKGKIKMENCFSETDEVTKNYFYSDDNKVRTIVYSNGQTITEINDNEGRMIKQVIVRPDREEFKDFFYIEDGKVITRHFQKVKTNSFEHQYVINLLSERLENKDGRLLYLHTNEGHEIRITEMENKNIKKYVELYPIDKDGTAESDIFFIEYNEDGTKKRTFRDSETKLEDFKYNDKGDVIEIIYNEVGYKEEIEYKYDEKGRIINKKTYYTEL